MGRPLRDLIAQHKAENPKGPGGRKRKYKPKVRARKPDGTEYKFIWDASTTLWTGTLIVPGKEPVIACWGAVRPLWERLDHLYDKLYPDEVKAALKAERDAAEAIRLAAIQAKAGA